MEIENPLEVKASPKIEEFCATVEAKCLAYSLANAMENDFGIRTIEFKNETAGDISYSNKETHEHSTMRITHILAYGNFVTIEFNNYWRHTFDANVVANISYMKITD